MPHPGTPPAPPAQMSLFDEVVAAPTAAVTPARPSPWPSPSLSPLQAPGVSAGSSPGAATPSAGVTAAPAVPAAPVPTSPRARHELLLGERRVPYELKRARRRSIGFTIGPDGLSVSAPRWVGLAEIEAALRGKQAWILRKLHEQQERARRQVAARVEWRDGSTLPFLGENLVLVLDPRCTGAVLQESPQQQAGQDGHLPGLPARALHLGLPQQASAEQVREMVQSWLQRQARRVFEERCAVYAQRLGVRIRRLSLSSAATRWGSASADGSIRLNWRLVHFGMPIIDYVVAHELAHLREMNHSAAFWDVVRSVIPGYEQARAALREGVLPVLDPTI
jgi:predicted metal-dependent hydrolase